MRKYKTKKIYCSKCRTLLYKYKKAGTGQVVKCFLSRIKDDYTDGKSVCPGCGREFCRRIVIGGVAANKLISGRVSVKN